MFFPRQLQKTLSRIEGMFGAILVTGARQVGKTTLLRNAKQDVPYVTMDDPIMLAAANDEPVTFLKMKSTWSFRREKHFILLKSRNTPIQQNATYKHLRFSTKSTESGEAQAESFAYMIKSSRLAKMMLSCQSNICRRVRLNMVCNM